MVIMGGVKLEAVVGIGSLSSLNKPRGLTRRIRPSLAASFFVSPFIAERRGKKGRGEAHYCINSGGRCGGVALANEVGWSDHCLLLEK